MRTFCQMVTMVGDTSPDYSHARGALCDLVQRGALDRDHPRMRGEHWPGRPSTCARPGSSPHARGALAARLVDPRVVGIIPACAGSTSRASLHSYRHAGSSPHARGARNPQGAGNLGVGIIPACAGSTFGSITTQSLMTGSSPHARGAQCRGSAARVCTGDHPRMRGEHSSRPGTSYAISAFLARFQNAYNHLHIPYLMVVVLPACRLPGAYDGWHDTPRLPRSCRAPAPPLRQHAAMMSCCHIDLLPCCHSVTMASAGRARGSPSGPPRPCASPSRPGRAPLWGRTGRLRRDYAWAER